MLESTPSALSLGRRVAIDGPAFFWPAWSYSPWLQHPTTGEKIELKVRDFVPYLDVPIGDAMPRTWEAGSRGGGGAAEIELIRARLKELYSKEAAKRTEPTTTAAPAYKGEYWKVSNFPGEGDIPSPTGGGDGSEPFAGGDPSSSSGDTVPPPSPPLPPPASPQELADAVALEASGGVNGPAEEDDPGFARLTADADSLKCEVCTDDFGDELYIDDGSVGRRSKLKAEACSARHLRLHQPKNPYCPTCVRANMMRRYAKRRKTLPQRIPEKFGDLVNADHLLAQSAESMGLFGERDALLIVDKFTEYVDAFPLKSKNARDALHAFNEYLGNDSP